MKYCYLLTQKYTSLLETHFSYFSFHAGVYEVPNFLLNCWTNRNYELQSMFFNDFWCIKYVTLCSIDEVVVKGVTQKSEVQTLIEAYHTVKVFINEKKSTHNILLESLTRPYQKWPSVNTEQSSNFDGLPFLTRFGEHVCKLYNCFICYPVV